LDYASIEEASRLAVEDANPIGDVRSTAEYRHEMIRICTLRGLRSLLTREERLDFPKVPILLGGKHFGRIRQTMGSSSRFNAGNRPISPILTRINGKEYSFTRGHQKTLLRLIREEAGLTGTKEGCAEGECGACTVFLDGMAVMSCLVPAPRAHGAEIETIEGLIQAGNLHPVQQAFIDEGAVQCGYCTPGFVMSGVKLLEEQPHPTLDDIRQAITGNLCRCTGYYKIVRAIERATEQEVMGES
jgi:carbon-monoxide dehydrogenase medium subunit